MAGILIHLHKTKAWALELGISEMAAAAISQADMLVDSDPKKYPRNLYHLHPILFGVDRRLDIAEQHFSQAQAAAEHGDCPQVWQNLGEGLHVLQDHISHGRYRLHLAWLDDLTRTAGRPDPIQSRMLACENVTKNFLQRALSDPQMRLCLFS
jgi:hypothetical protein